MSTVGLDDVDDKRFSPGGVDEELNSSTIGIVTVCTEPSFEEK
jgi:hypothetical protein